MIERNPDYQDSIDITYDQSTWKQDLEQSIVFDNQGQDMKMEHPKPKQTITEFAEQWAKNRGLV